MWTGGLEALAKERLRDVLSPAPNPEHNATDMTD
jgi:hypothetical protein